jgi:hypothetical protein
VLAVSSLTMDPDVSATFMTSLLFWRILFRDALSSLWEARRGSAARFSFRDFVFGARPEPGARPDAGAAEPAVADADEAAGTESVDAMMQPDADKRRRV